MKINDLLITRAGCVHGLHNLETMPFDELVHPKGSTPDSMKAYINCRIKKIDDAIETAKARKESIRKKMNFYAMELHDQHTLAKILARYMFEKNDKYTRSRIANAIRQYELFTGTSVDNVCIGESGIYAEVNNN